MTPEDLETLRETWDFEAKLAGGADGRGGHGSLLDDARTEGAC